jgi:hypothetical protein
VIILGIIIYGLLTIAFTSKTPKTTISNTPAINQNPNPNGIIFDLAQENIPGNEKFILKLVAKKVDERRYEGYYGHGTRNLLHVDQLTGDSNWLFPTQEQNITSIDLLADDKKTALGLLVTTRRAGDDEEETSNSLTKSVDVYFVTLDLKKKHLMLKDVEHVFTSKQFGKNWALIYKKSMEIHHAVFSLSSGEVISEKTVATLQEVK